MNELGAIVDAYRSFAADGQRSVLLTLVDVVGSSCRRPGAKMIVNEEGRSTGFIGGGCLEGDLAEHSKHVLDGDRSRTITYDLSETGDLAWGLGIGCPGKIVVFIENVDESLADRLGEWSQVEEPAVAITVFETTEGSPREAGMRWLMRVDNSLDGLSVEDQIVPAVIRVGRKTFASRKSVVEEISDGPATIRILAEYLQPPLKLIVFGSGKDAAALLRIASGMNWEATVVDPAAGDEGTRRYPESAEIIAEEPVAAFDDLTIDDRTAVVMMSHLYQRDRALLELLTPTDAKYIGLLGAASRRDSLTSGLAPETREKLQGRLHAPVGLDIGGDSPEEIALSVAAEIVAVFAGRKGGLLRDRDEPIHD